MRQRLASQCKGAFSLVELLIVVAIIGVMAVLAVPAVVSVMESFRIAQGLNLVLESLSEARQYASSLNRPVEVRFCQGADGYFNIVAVCSIEPDGTVKPIKRAQELPEAVCISEATALSSVFKQTAKSAGASDPSIAGLGQNYKYYKIRFQPSGVTDLNPEERWFVTVLNDKFARQAAPPKNFAVAQIDPVNGLTTYFRP